MTFVTTTEGGEPRIRSGRVARGAGEHLRNQNDTFEVRAQAPVPAPRCATYTLAVPPPRELWAVLRRQGWLILASVLVGVTFFGTASALSPKIYESRAEVQISPVSLHARFDTPDAPTTPAQAMAREMESARSVFVLGRADDQLAFDHSLGAEQASEDTIAFVARSINGPYAEAAAEKVASIYVTVREETATGLANSSVEATQQVIDDLTALQAAGEDVSADLAEQEARLDDFQAGLSEAADTARITLGPTDAGEPIAPHPWKAATKGLAIGLVAGLLIAAVREFLRVRPLPADVSNSLPRVVVERRDGGTWRFAWAHRRRTAVAILTGLVVARAAIYVAMGVNFILDDWSLEYQRATAGAWSSVPTGQDLVNARPGAWLVFTVLHAAIGPHPLIHFLVLTAINLALVVALYLVFERFVSRPLALLITAIWVVLPIHQSMTVWTGTAQIAVGGLVFVLGLLAFTHGRWLPAGLGFGASILCYELSVPAAFAAVALVATLLLPLNPEAKAPRPITIRTRAATLVFVVAATAWSRSHPVYDLDLRMPSPATLWSGHFGVGLFGDLDTPNLLVMAAGGFLAVGIVCCLVAWMAGDRERESGPSMVVTGTAVFALGLAVSFTANTGVLGFNDRLYALSSIGAAVMLAGLGVFLWRRAPALTVGLAGLLLATAVVGQVLSLQSWSRAGADVVALLDYIEQTYPDPDGTHFIVGPSPQIRNNVMGAQSPFGGADAAYRLAFPDAGPPCVQHHQRATTPVETCQGSLWMASSPEEFTPTPWGETVINWYQVLGADGIP